MKSATNRSEYKITPESRIRIISLVRLGVSRIGMDPNYYSFSLDILTVDFAA